MAAALKALKAVGAPAVPALVETLNNDSSLVRRSAASILAALGPKAKSAHPALLRAARETTEMTDIPQFTQAIRAIGVHDAETRDVLLNLTRAKYTAARRGAWRRGLPRYLPSWLAASRLS